MTIDEAIKRLKSQEAQKRQMTMDSSADAIKLGIEALKAIRDTRLPHSRILPSYLPGENES